MQASVNNKGAVIVVELSGRVDIEKALSFKDAVKLQLARKKVVFNMEKLSFVGSSGIQTLFQAFREIRNDSLCEFRLVGMPIDFQKVWQLNVENDLAIYGTTEAAVLSFL